MTQKNYYEILDLSLDASPQTIKEQYRFMLHAWHPDKFPNPQQKIRAEERTKNINEAYEVLSDPQKRSHYNEFLLKQIKQSQSAEARGQHADAQESLDPEQRRAEYVRQRQYEAAVERQRVEKEREQFVRDESERLRAEQQGQNRDHANSATKIRPNFPITCQKCGRSDASLRWAAFPYVVSVVILTFRRSWGGLFCGQCRRQEMFKAKLLTLCFGWWGIPWGFFYTLGVLFKSDNGDTPVEANADYLKALGAYFLQSGQIGEALLTFNSSLQLRRDSQLEQLVKELFGRTSITPLPTAQSGGIGFTPILFGAGAIILVVFLMVPSFSAISLPGDDSANAQTNLIIRQPTVIRTPTNSPATSTVTLPPQDWRLYNSEAVGFSAYIPSKWTGSSYPSTADDQVRGVEFFPSITIQGADETIIRVMSVPLGDFSPTQAMSVAELKQNGTDWLTDQQVRIIRAPVEARIGEQAAIWMVYETEMQDKGHKLLAYAAMLSTLERFYYIEVAGLAGYEEVVHSYFDKFVKHFQPNQS